MKKLIIIIILLSVQSDAFSQVNAYFDRELKRIDISTYIRKCNRVALKCKSFTIPKSDTIFHVVYDKYKFGKLNKYHYNRIKNEIYRNTNFNGIIMLHYRDSLITFDEYRDDIEIKNKEYDSINWRRERHFVRRSDIKNKSKKDVLRNRKYLTKRINKCIKKYKKKYNTDLIHYYGYGKKDELLYPNFIWKKDENQLIKNYFFKYVSQFYYAIIKPDGEYMLIGDFISPNRIKKLLKKKDWSKIKISLKKTYKLKKNTSFFYKEHVHNCL